MSGRDENDFSRNGHVVDDTVLTSTSKENQSSSEAAATPLPNPSKASAIENGIHSSKINGDTTVANSSKTQSANQQISTTQEFIGMPKTMESVSLATSTTTTSTPTKPSNWVQFENDEDQSDKGECPNKYAINTSTSAVSPSTSPPPVLTTESVHINIKDLPSTNHPSQAQQKQISSSSPAVIDIPTSGTGKSITTSFSAPASHEQGLRTIELSSGRVREGFANGDVIVTLLPINTKWPWITPALFRPELVPEELMAQGLTLTVEEYVHAMETLVNDFRFTLYNVCYKRVLLIWVLFAFCVLLGLLFSGLKGIGLFSLGVGWLFLNAAAIFMCMWIKLRLARGLERCLASVNKQLLRHKIILALDDRGHISCHKVNLCFMYYDPEQCVNYLNEFIERSEQNGTMIEAGWESRLDVDANDIVIQGSNTTRVSRKQDRAVLLFLRYASRWANEVIRGLGDVSLVEPGRHCASYICPCQYIERHLKCKPQDQFHYLSNSSQYYKLSKLSLILINTYENRWLTYEF